MSRYWYDWRPYVPVASRRQKAIRKIAALRKRGKAVDPVVIEGRTIARTFWGKAWCENLERYSDFENRLPRGRTYVRNGSVIDLKILPGQVTALVSGSSFYQVHLAIKPAARNRWRALSRECSGQIASMVELLQGEFSSGVMKIMARRDTGLFPSPSEISLACTCPDWATMCKHIAAVLYGVGARLDHSPDLLFVLRKVDPMDLVARAGRDDTLGKVSGETSEQILESSDLSKVFGIDLGERKTSPRRSSPSRARRTKVAPIAARARQRPAKKSARSRRGSGEITARQLIQRGVPRSTFQNWFASGVLLRTTRRGVYRKTSTTAGRIAKVRREKRRSR